MGFLDRIKEIWYNQNVTTTYTYGDTQWGDLLTKYQYDDIIYDPSGNPWKKGFRISGTEFEFGYEYEWDGRQLMSIKYFDMFSTPYYMQTIDFTYNADGIRTSKTVDGVEHKYYLNGSQIIAETWTQNNVEHLIVFVYDETGSPMAMKYRTSSYAKDTYDYFFYEKNLQGDIVGIYDASGVKIGTYKYDAWGSHTTTVTSGNTTLENSIVRTYNPFRYRGYYYDTETSLYYLQSRYYDPAMSRFINADETSYLGINADLISYNLYAYCSNNPIKYTDPTGHFIISLAIIKVVVIVIAVAATANDVYQIASGNVTAEVTASSENGDDADDVQINDSYKILTPWVQYGYSAYLNHINEDTKNVIDGTVMGTTYEWGLHNIAYYASSVLGLEKYANSARSVNVGKTLFSDNHGGFIEHTMKISYTVLNPLAAITDMIINGGYQ